MKIFSLSDELSDILKFFIFHYLLKKAVGIADGFFVGINYDYSSILPK